MKYLIVGLGITGLSCARFLVARGEDVAVIDSRDNPPCLEVLKKQFPDVPCYLGQFDETLIQSAETLVISQGVDHRLPIFNTGAPIIGDIELFSAAANAPVIGITGSNGKSTVTTLLGEVLAATGLKVKVGGNLGTPALDLLATPAPDFYVLELSNFQLETTCSLKPYIACLLNVSPDHLDRYDSYEDYIAAKRRIFKDSEHQVINADDANTAYEKETACAFSKKMLDDLDVSGFKLQGQHNHLNACAVLCVTDILNLPREQVLKTIAHFKGLPHRCEWVANIDGVDWINDSKGTNEFSTLAALDSFPGKSLVWIAGGRAKGPDFSALREGLQQPVAQAIFCGEAGPQLLETFEKEFPSAQCETLAEAVSLAKKLAKPGQTVLFSPACTSWDAFKSFVERGECFRGLVRGEE